MQTRATSITRPASPEEQDRSNTIKIATWVLLGVTIAMFIARQIMKAIVFRRVTLDDFFMLSATAFAIGLSITVFVLASEGLGGLGLLTLERADTLMKGYYASEFLYIASLCFSKLSLLVLFYTVVAGQRLPRRLVLGFGTFIFVWSVGSLLVVAFQCELPRPWETMTLRCFNTRVFWIVFCIIDMSTEISIIMLSVNLVAYLRVKFSRKIAVVACFAPRMLVIAASLVRLIWLYPITPHSAPEFRLWLPAILTQVHVCSSICTACIPYMVPFFKSLEGSLRRTQSSKSPEFRMDERTGRSMSSLWFRRHSKAKAFQSWDSTAVAVFQYERVPQASPHIPTPRAMSPLTPPVYISRPTTANSRSPSARGLTINIPGHNSPVPNSMDVASPQTASSFTLSPSCTTPIRLLPFPASRKDLTSPLKAYSPNPPSGSSGFSSRLPSPISPARPVRFSLFPPPSENRYSPDLRNVNRSSVSVPPIRNLRPQNIDGIARHPTVPRIYASTNGYKSRVRSASATQPPKFSTAPQPRSPPSTTTSPTSKRRHASAQDLTSPMGAAINHYFSNTSPETRPSVPTPTVAPLSLHRQRNQRVLLPSNALRIHGASPTSPPHAPLPALPSDGSMILNSGLRPQIIPTVRDVRSSPRIVVRKPS
ncbi:hypothetical protein CC86DRAFT_352416 [Ophiobolus disseminans]|uniref:Rhodopsin domain-containing protein n=1 Tax=Ophiobolus disseminans TaxID=1469910 RepID=A0A6A6ZXD9_9PLEO|nr:hypothetical protein CC86DRAFT_352416 [Ophiobolus disseminans]